MQETKTRLAQLETNVADLQKLLVLKNQTLAELQKPGTPPAVAPSAPSAAVSPAGPATTAVTPPPAAVAPKTTPPAAPLPDASTPVPAPAPAVVAPPAKAAAPAPAPVEASWFDGLRDNTLLLVGLLAIVLLLIGYGVFTARRRRKLASFEDSIFVDNSVLHANSVFGTTGGQSVDTANSGFHSNFVPVAGNLPEQNEVDPVAEADVYIAYGRDAQAEEILKEALRADGSRHAVRLKLLEIYAKRGDAKTFETMASELYAATGGQGEDWKQAAALGATVDPHNPLYVESGARPVPADLSRTTTGPAVSTMDSAAATRTGLGAAALGGLSATDLNMGDSASGGEHVAPTLPMGDMTRTDPLPRPAPTAATSAPSMDLDFDLGFGNAKQAPLTAGTPAVPAAGADGANGKDNGLDFDVGGSSKTLIEPFTASAFGTGDASARTAVNLPAFRARAEKEPAPRPESDGFSASDIFGSSIVADTEPLYDDPARTLAAPPEPTPVQARTTDFRNVVDSHQFDKTEPLDAFSNINLDLDSGNFNATTIAPDGNRTDVWQAMATKLDLALAYSDIGDKDGALELLEEVVRSGDSAQADRAKQLIGELG